MKTATEITIDKQALEYLERTEAGASPGPWLLREGEGEHGPWIETAGGERVMKLSYDDSQADARLICDARNSLKHLLRYTRRALLPEEEVLRRALNEAATLRETLSYAQARVTEQEEEIRRLKAAGDVIPSGAADLLREAHEALEAKNLPRGPALWAAMVLAVRAVVLLADEGAPALVRSYLATKKG